jgi:predicted nucleic acid-binding protein
MALVRAAKRAAGERAPPRAATLNLVQELLLRLDGQADSDATLQLARAHRLTIYDAAYLEHPCGVICRW